MMNLLTVICKRHSVNMANQIPLTFLNNGEKVPLIGLGTWRSKPSKLSQVLNVAIKAGYRHIDCAYVYENEFEIGRTLNNAFAQQLIERKDLFITTKLWSTFHGDPNRVVQGVRHSLSHLRMLYVDLLLMHWPFGYITKNEEMLPKKGKVEFAPTSFIDVYKGMEVCVEIGLCKFLGVSNFNKTQIDRLLETAKIKPTLNQIEVHPYLNQVELIEHCKKVDVQVCAFSPLGSPESVRKDSAVPLTDPVVLRIADRIKKTPGQVLIRYPIERGLMVITKSVTPSRILENISVFDFNLSDEDMKALMNLEKGEKGRSVGFKALKSHPEYPFK